MTPESKPPNKDEILEAHFYSVSEGHMKVWEFIGKMHANGIDPDEFLKEKGITVDPDTMKVTIQRTGDEPI